MKPERNRQIDRLFQEALARDPAARAAFMDEACAGDPDLRREIEALLSSDEQARNFIESPALEIAPELVADARATRVTGKIVGPYRLDAPLGAGGMGEVYLAQDMRLGRRVALKLLDPALIGDGGLRTRFIREARLASSLDHPNVCAVHEVGEAEGRLFIAMQYVEGGTLREVVGGHPLGLDALLSISLQVADALAEAHEAGIIHRDIKPANIIVTPKGQAKVLDFGLAKLLERVEGEAETHLTMTGAVMGTPAAMSPEQARGQRVDRRSDIFSFGVVMYEMATGRIPFKGKTRADVISALLTQPHTPAAELNKEIPARLSAVIDRALAKEPAERYQSMLEMLADLRQVVAEAGGLDHLFHSSGARLGVMIPYVPPRRRTLLKRPSVLAALAVALAALAVAAAGVIYSRYARSNTTATDSIAVLPFVNADADPNTDWLSDGITESLINNLSQLPKLRVMARTTVFRYKGLGADPQKVGHELGVRAVLTGKVLQRGDTLVVQADLADVATGAQLWGAQYNRRVSDIFSVQEDIASQISSKMRLRLTGEEQRLLAERPTDDAAAYELYLKGKYFSGGNITEEGLKKGVEYYQQAIRLDPDYALAYVGLAGSYMRLGGVWGFSPPRETYPQAQSALTKALEIDGTLADAHASLGSYKLYYEWDWPGAEASFKRAIELSPNHAGAHGEYGSYFQIMGRLDEAVAERKRRRELDPLSPTATANVGYPYYYKREYDQAIEFYRRALELDPDYSWGHLWIGLAYIQKGMNDEAVAEMSKAVTLSRGNVRAVATLGYALAVAGKRGEAEKVIAELREQSGRRYVSAYFIAVIYAGLGEKDQTFDWLEKAYEERHPYLTTLKVEPVFDSLRSDPRFADLLRRVGLPQ